MPWSIITCTCLHRLSPVFFRRLFKKSSCNIAHLIRCSSYYSYCIVMGYCTQLVVPICADQMAGVVQVLCRCCADMCRRYVPNTHTCTHPCTLQFPHGQHILRDQMLKKFAAPSEQKFCVGGCSWRWWLVKATKVLQQLKKRIMPW